MLEWTRDLRLGFRTLLRTPGFGLTTILTLALGIGATTSLFTVVNAVILDPLPFPQSRQLVQVWRAELPALTYGAASYPRYLDWRREQRAFTDLGAWAPRGMTIAGSGGPERVNGATASASFFNVVGTAPARGRWITDADDRPGSENVAVISDRYWRQRFGASGSALGSTLMIDGQSFTIVGVAPAAYSEIWRPDVWIPLAPTASSNRDSNYLLSFGRLKDSATIDDARRALASLAADMHRDHNEDNYTFTARLLYEVVTDSAAPALWMLLGATGLLLLIACANVANLLLARAVSQQRDLAIRASLGASWTRLVRQIAAETVALGLVAAVAGTSLAWLLVRAFVAVAPPNFPRVAAIVIDARVLAFSLATAVVVCLVASLAPALHVSRSDLNAVERAGGSRGTTSIKARAASRLLVGAEMALALALVATAGLMAKSLLRLQAQDLGWTRDPVLTFGIGLPPSVAPDAAAISRLHTEFLSRVRAIPGLTDASAINALPIVVTGMNGPVRRADQADDRAVPVTEFRAVMDQYFETMDVRVLAGRTINDRDRAPGPSVAVVNDTLAGRLFPGVDAAHIVGRQIRIGWLRGEISEVVGVVSSVRSRRPDAPPDPELYVPFAQAPQATMTYVVRSTGNVMALIGPIRATLGAMAPNVAMSAVRTLDDVVSTSTRLSSIVSWLSLLFGTLAALLAAVGIYSVLSYAVAQRKREFAIRAAVGATRATLIVQVIREGLTLSGIGIVVGAGIAWQTSGLIRHLLYNVSATDPAVFGAAVAGLALVAFAGYVIPAARASHADPIEALRQE